MRYLKKWTLATAGATVCLAGIVGASTGLAGAAPAGDPLDHSTGARQSNAISIASGTYEWYVNGSPDGTITIAPGNTFTSTVFGTNDSGTWIQAGETFGLSITGGTDGAAGCTFAGHVLAANEVSYAAKPGHWACPGYGSSGTFYIAPAPPGASANHAHRDGFATAGAVPMSAGKILAGKYKWLLDGDYPGVMKVASSNTYTSTLSTNDAGNWVQSGSAATFSINAGTDGGGGCLFAGKVNHTGTAVGTTAKPGDWVCPGYGTNGFFTLTKKS
jgi:hypothetical protein